MTIRKVKARTIFDTEAKSTLEVDLITDIGLFRSSVPSEFSQNPFGLQTLRDNAVDIVNNVIGPELVKSNYDVKRQKDIDQFLVQLDGTDDKSKLGSVAIFAVSSACCKAGAVETNTPLYKYISNLAEQKQMSIPVPVFSVISGGNLANNALNFLDYAILPIGASNFENAFQIGNQVYRTLESKIATLDEVKLPLPVSSIGAFIPQNIEDDADALQLIDDTIKELSLDDKVKIKVNVNASSCFQEDTGMYNLNYKTTEEDEEYEDTPEDIKETYVDYIKQFPNLVSIEDPFYMDDIDSWPLTMDLPLQIICNEAAANRSDRLREITQRAGANCVTLEPWLAGTITESLIFAKLAISSNWKINVGAGFAQTEDNFIVDFAVGLSATLFSSGAPVKSAKYNHLMRIEKERSKQSIFAGTGLTLRSG